MVRRRLLPDDAAVHCRGRTQRVARRLEDLVCLVDALASDGEGREGRTLINRHSVHAAPFTAGGLPRASGQPPSDQGWPGCSCSLSVRHAHRNSPHNALLPCTCLHPA